MSLIEKSLDFRNHARRFILSWFKPSILTAECSREELNRSLQQHWPDTPIKVYELIYENWELTAAGTQSTPNNHSDHFIVFIDPEFAIDWINNGEANETELQCISLAESIGAKRCNHLSRDQVLEFRRLIGQAIVNGIRGNAKQSCAMAETAAQFLKDRTIERSRAWTLASAHCLLLAASTIAAFFLTVPLFYNLLAGTSGGLWLAAAGGLLGAYLSVLQKAGSGEWDAASGLRIHVLEVLTKFAAGTLFGGIAFAISQSVHAPPSIKSLTPDPASLFLFGFAAGLFERLIPKMVSAYSESYTNEEPKKSHDTKSSPHRIIQRKGPNGPPGSSN
jgi:hypothetical protein